MASQSYKQIFRSILVLGKRISKPDPGKNLFYSTRKMSNTPGKKVSVFLFNKDDANRLIPCSLMQVLLKQIVSDRSLKQCGTVRYK